MGLFLIKLFQTIGMALTIFMPIILGKNGYNAQEISYIVAFVGIGYVPMSILAGSLSDLYDNKTVFNILKFISIVMLFILMITHNKIIIAIGLVVVISINNGLDPIVVSAAIETVAPEKRSDTFGMLQLALSIGMAAFSLSNAYLLRLSSYVLYSVLIIISIITILVMNAIYREESVKQVEVKDIKSDEEKDSKTNKRTGLKSFLKVFLGEKVLFIFSVILIAFSILYAQQNYGLTYKLEEIYGDKASMYLGNLTFIYYITMVVSNRILMKLTKKIACIKNIIIAGVMYTISMCLITNTTQFLVLTIGIVFWAMGQLLINVNNVLFIAERSNEKNKATYNAVFSIISGSGSVIGPLIGGMLLKTGTVETLWLIMCIISLIGTLGMCILYKVQKKYI